MKLAGLYITSCLLSLLYLSNVHSKEYCSCKNWEAYISTQYNVDVIDTRSQTKVASIDHNIGFIIDEPSSIVSAVNGQFMYFTNQLIGTVGIVDTCTNELVGEIAVGELPFDITLNPAGTTAYVANFRSDSISVIDLATNRVTDTLFLQANSRPAEIAITNDGMKGYISTANNSVTVFDTVTLKVLTIIPDIRVPSRMIINPTTGDAYVTSNTSPGSYYIIDTINENVMGPYETGGNGARGIDITADGKIAYIANIRSDEISVMNLVDNSLIKTVPVGLTPSDVVIAPDQNHAYVENTLSNDVTVINLPDNTADPFPIAVGLFPRSMGIIPNSCRGYVVNFGDDTISVIDLMQKVVTDTITSQALFRNPLQLAIDPWASHAYVANTPSSVTKVDICSRQISSDIKVGLSPQVVAITPNGTKAYVSNSTSDTISVINTAKNTVLKTIDVGSGPYGVAIHPSGTQVYIANSLSDTVSIIDVETDALIGELSFPENSFVKNIAFTPDGMFAYISAQESDSVFAISIPDYKIVAEISVGVDPEWIAITPDGSKAYVTNPGSGSISVISTVNNATVKTIEFPDAASGPSNMAITPDGAKAFVTLMFTNQVAVIDLENNEISQYIPVDSRPFGIAITPDQAPIAAFKATNSCFGLQLDASRSCSPVGDIASYHWDFGDGQSTTCFIPWLCHTYSRPGVYLVTLTVTNTLGTSTEGHIFTGQTLYTNGGPSAAKSKEVCVTTGLFPPRDLQAKKIFNDGKSVNHITWKAPCKGISPSNYIIYRDPELKSYVATVSACAKLEYFDSSEASAYYIVSADCCKVISFPAGIHLHR